MMIFRFLHLYIALIVINFSYSSSLAQKDLSGLVSSIDSFGKKVATKSQHITVDHKNRKSLRDNKIKQKKTLRRENHDYIDHLLEVDFSDSTPTMAPVEEAPTHSPTEEPSQASSSVMPTEAAPSMIPTGSPTEEAPSDAPTAMPTEESPSEVPTAMPTEKAPSEMPTAMPTEESPSFSPTLSPMEEFQPTHLPTEEAPSLYPTASPTEEPVSFAPTTPGETNPPSSAPTHTPSAEPTTADPTSSPSSNAPTHSGDTNPPSEYPTAEPSAEPSAKPTIPAPTHHPSGQPSEHPTHDPSANPSASPTPQYTHPTSFPTVSFNPTDMPTVAPTIRPSASPSELPTHKPSASPTLRPSPGPTLTRSPVPRPTSKPSREPTFSPTYTLVPYAALTFNISQQFLANISANAFLTDDSATEGFISVVETVFLPQDIDHAEVVGATASSSRRRLLLVTDVESTSASAPALQVTYLSIFHVNQANATTMADTLQASLAVQMNYSVSSGQFTTLMQTSGSSALSSFQATVVPTIPAPSIVYEDPRPLSTGGDDDSLSDGAIAGITIGVIVFVAILIAIVQIYYFGGSKLPMISASKSSVPEGKKSNFGDDFEYNLNEDFTGRGSGVQKFQNPAFGDRRATASPANASKRASRPFNPPVSAYKSNNKGGMDDDREPSFGFRNSDL